jgi:hypothetical protein
MQPVVGQRPRDWAKGGIATRRHAGCSGRQGYAAGGWPLKQACCCCSRPAHLGGRDAAGRVTVLLLLALVGGRRRLSALALRALALGALTLGAGLLLSVVAGAGAGARGRGAIADRCELLGQELGVEARLVQQLVQLFEALLAQDGSLGLCWLRGVVLRRAREGVLCEWGGTQGGAAGGSGPAVPSAWCSKPAARSGWAPRAPKTAHVLSVGARLHAQDRGPGVAPALPTGRRSRPPRAHGAAAPPPRTYPQAPARARPPPPGVFKGRVCMRAGHRPLGAGTGSNALRRARLAPLFVFEPRPPAPRLPPRPCRTVTGCAELTTPSMTLAESILASVGFSMVAWSWAVARAQSPTATAAVIAQPVGRLEIALPSFTTLWQGRRQRR